MTEEKRKLHYLAEWRRFRGLSQGRLVLRMEREPGEEVLSTASLSRIENGVQTMSAELAHQFAHALDCDPGDLFSINPLKDGQIIDLMAIIRKLQRDDLPKLAELTKIAKAIA